MPPPATRVIALVSAALVLTLLGVVIVPTAFAKIARNTIDPVALVTDDGHHVIVTGPIACDGGERALLRVTVTQRTTGAVAEGLTRVVCLGAGADQQWEVHAQTQGKEAFEPGVATAIGLGRTTARGETTDAHQWLVNITLVAE